MKQILFTATLLSSLVLTACQTAAPKQFNGTSGYQVEQQNKTSAVINYTMAANTKAALKQQRLENACKAVLGANNTYQVKILNETEVVQQAQDTSPNRVAINHSRASFGLSNTADLKHNDQYMTNQGLERPATVLSVTRYICE